MKRLFLACPAAMLAAATPAARSAFERSEWMPGGGGTTRYRLAPTVAEPKGRFRAGLDDTGTEPFAERALARCDNRA